MELQTKIKLEKQIHNPIDYDSNLLFLGSCFSENIARKFQYFKFQTEANPFGILFQPLAIENLISRAINQTTYVEADLFRGMDAYFSFDAHSELRGQSAIELLNLLNNKLAETATNLKKATQIVITLGTSWVYRHISSDTIVANCHKVPQKQFIKELLTIEEISASLQSMIALIRTINPKVTFIFTISPVRHLKDGFIENNRSKSHLLAAVHDVVDPRNHLHYFPSYEIQMDELRDYRFYGSDMVHPSALAVDIIWNYFKTGWVSEKIYNTMEEVAAIQKALAHKPFNPKSMRHADFLAKVETKIAQIQLNFPQISFK